jgi:uncharacterized protein YxeA
MKTKKSIQLLLIALIFMPTMANAFTGTAVIDGINYYINTDNQTAEVRAYFFSINGYILRNEDGKKCEWTVPRSHYG